MSGLWMDGIKKSTSKTPSNAQANIITIKCFKYISPYEYFGEKIASFYNIFVGDCVTFIFLAYWYKNDSHMLQLHAVLLSLCTYI